MKSLESALTRKQRTRANIERTKKMKARLLKKGFEAVRFGSTVFCPCTKGTVITLDSAVIVRAHRVSDNSGNIYYEGASVKTAKAVFYYHVYLASGVDVSKRIPHA